MDRRLRAGLEAGGVLVLTGVVAIVVNNRQEHLIDPTSVTLLGTPDADGDRVAFLIRGAGCPAPPEARDHRGNKIKSPASRVKAPTLQYTTHTIDVHFRVEDPGQWRCTGQDPGVRYTLKLVLPLGERVLRDADKTPPVPFTQEPTK